MSQQNNSPCDSTSQTHTHTQSIQSEEGRFWKDDLYNYICHKKYAKRKTIPKIEQRAAN